MERLARFKWTAVHKILHDKQGLRYYFIALSIIISVGIGVLLWMRLQPPASPSTAYNSALSKPEPAKYYSPLTGAEVSDEAATKRPVTAVMIENSLDARPQSGLKEAGVVYEAIAEGGITRFIALYQESRPGLIGPVRSVRPYFVEWASAYDAAVAHIGGSARALQMIRSGTYGVDLDQFFNAASYWRANDRYAPHNVYTNFDKLDALVALKGKTTSSYTPLPRKDDKKAKSPTAAHINLPISSPAFAVDYTYDSVCNCYSRSIGGAAHLDREAGQISPRVVVAMQVAMTRQMEDGYREQIVTIGSGRAFIFQDGLITEGTWQRSDEKAQISLNDSAGKSIKLNRGQTWFTALPESKVPSWQ